MIKRFTDSSNLLNILSGRAKEQESRMQEIYRVFLYYWTEKRGVKVYIQKNKTTKKQQLLMQGQM